MNPNHHLFDFRHGLHSYLLILIFIPLFVFGDYYTEFSKLVTEYFRKPVPIKGFNKDMTDIEGEINENIDPYFNCLPGLLQKRFYARECHLRDYFGTSQFNRKSMELLRT